LPYLVISLDFALGSIKCFCQVISGNYLNFLGNTISQLSSYTWLVANFDLTRSRL